jgi:hypothetical protein
MTPSVTITIAIDVARGDQVAKRADQVSKPVDHTSRHYAALLPTNYDMRTTGKRLLFVTATEQLIKNVGYQEAGLALAAIRAAGHSLLEVQQPANPYHEVRNVLTGLTYDGVVVLGGYDVLPSARMDVLDPALREQVGYSTAHDPDAFIVWSDLLYGDSDGDQMPDLPVSRIPDGKSSALLRAALTAREQSGGSAFGLRNVQRPFADDVFKGIAGEAKPLQSEPQSAIDFTQSIADATAYYLMLHGSYNDSSRFWGEKAGSDPSEDVEAFNIDNVPDSTGGIVFAGCCWGALAVQNRAVDFQPGQTIQALTPNLSIALKFLEAGAKAFVGCTGSHWSPLTPPLDYYGGPMHTAFWQNVMAGGQAPALALFNAMKRYARDIPHGRTTGFEQAVEMKTLWEFTCLGLGW